MNDRYGQDVLASDPHRPNPVPSVAASPGLVVEDVESGWVGAVVRVERIGGRFVVELEDRRGQRRGFPLGPGFWIDGRPIVLVRPTVAPTPVRPQRTASGSRAVADRPARVARASRLWVEGRHDAELIEKVWGDDLRVEGVVVEILGGIDHLADRLAVVDPTPHARVGVLVDHMVPGSKEQRLADAVARDYSAASVLVVGHPFVDVWQSIKPARLGLDAWPRVPREIEWKRGVLAHLGWPAASQADIADGWQRILGRVRDFRDLAPEFLGRVEELIDFVTVGPEGGLSADGPAA